MHNAGGVCAQDFPSDPPRRSRRIADARRRAFLSPDERRREDSADMKSILLFGDAVWLFARFDALSRDKTCYACLCYKHDDIRAWSPFVCVRCSVSLCPDCFSTWFKTRPLLCVKCGQNMLCEGDVEQRVINPQRRTSLFYFVSSLVMAIISLAFFSHVFST